MTIFFDYDGEIPCAYGSIVSLGHTVAIAPYCWSSKLWQPFVLEGKLPRVCWFSDIILNAYMGRDENDLIGLILTNFLKLNRRFDLKNFCN